MLPRNKLISFVIPSRARKEMLLTCINNLVRQIPAERRNIVEIILRLDTDDPSSKDIISELPYDQIDLQIILGYHGNGYRDGYIWAEECARLARGTFFAFWNDDANFATEDWFAIFLKHISSQNNIYSYWFSGPTTTIKAADGSVTQQEWPCFIFHHRKFWEITGFISGPGGVDSFLVYTLDPLGLLKKIPEIRIDHTPWYEKPKDSWDEVTKANSEVGQMVATDFSLVEQCQQKIIAFVQHSKTNK